MRQIGVGDFTVTEKMRQNIKTVLDTERISYGPFSKEFESRFAEIHDCKYGVLSNSGTSSLQVALQALKELHDWQDGDEIIVPAVTFVATVNVVLHNNLKPILVDVEPDYYGIDIEQILEAITPKTRAIIPVHLFGMPCDLAGINELLISNMLDEGICIIEDSCECMFAKHYNYSVGSWGSISCFSTYVAHLLTTGVGGIAITNHKPYAEKMRSLVNHGRDGIYISIDDDDNPTEEIIKRRFNFESVGHSYRITELEAALAVAQLDGWKEMIAKRQENAAYLYTGLFPLREHLQLPEIRPNTSHSFMVFPVVCKQKGTRDKLALFLENKGIETRHMVPLTNQPVYSSWVVESDYPIAEYINNSGFYFGCYPSLTKSDLDYMIEVFNGYFE